jgi:hypothetical protein
MNIKEKIEVIINELIQHGIIPSDGKFEVTADLIDKYRIVYGVVNNVPLFPKLNKADNRLSRKLAALTLLEFTLSKGYKPKAGFVYGISNPSYPGYYKIGITQDLDKRLSTYQTYDPHRQFKVEHYRFVEDKRLEEKRILQQYQTDLSKGEWITTEKLSDIFPETM